MFCGNGKRTENTPTTHCSRQLPRRKSLMTSPELSAGCRVHGAPLVPGGRMHTMQVSRAGSASPGNQQSEPASAKQLTMLVGDDNIQALKLKLKFWKAYILHYEPASFRILKDILGQFVVILMNMDFFFKRRIKMCQPLQDLHSPVNQYFPNDQCLMSRNLWVKKEKILFKVWADFLILT